MTRLHRIPSGAYGAVAMALHWLIALLLITVVMLGVYMVGLPLKTELLSGRSVITNTHRVGVSVLRSSTDSAHGILSRTATIRARLDQACDGRNLDERNVRNDTA